MDEEYCDSSSIASDFSIIPDSMVHAHDKDELDSDLALAAPSTTGMSQELEKSISGKMNHSFGTTQEKQTSSPMPISNYLTSVIFGTIQRVNNNPNGDLAVVFFPTKDYIIKSTDRIALYKAGFSSSKDFITSAWVPIVSASPYDSLSQMDSSLNVPVPSTVHFIASTIPDKKDGELYQFCYLTHEGQISGVSVSFDLEQVEKSQLVDIENTARNILALRVNDLLKEKEKLSLHISELQKKTQTSASSFEEKQFEFDRMLERCQELEEKLVKLSTKLEKAEAKNDAQEFQFTKTLEQERLEKARFNDKFKDLTFELCTLKEKLKEMKNSESLMADKQEVILQDNSDLKLTVKHLKNDLENAYKEKDATQKVAAHLSDNNMKMANKMANLMRVEMNIMEAVTSEGFECVRKESSEPIVFAAEPAPSNTSVSLSCVDKELGESLCFKMDSIMKELGELKSDARKSLQGFVLLQPEESLAPVTSSTPDELKIVQEGERLEYEEIIFENEGERLENKESILENEEEILENKEIILENEGQAEEHRTPCSGMGEVAALPSAPVYLPHSSTLDSSYSFIEGPTLSRLSSQSSYQTDPERAEIGGRSVNNAMTSPQAAMTSSPAITTSSQNVVIALPPPLLPETTVTARQAAVLNQFNEPRGNHESDDDDYHSTSENGEASLNRPKFMICPMCLLEFLPNAMHLLKEHLESHMDKICPVCSEAFSKTVKQEEFESHVHLHFADEEPVRVPDSTNRDDPSGPWGPNSPGSGFHLLEID